MSFDWTPEGQDKYTKKRRGIGGVRARRLYDAGYATSESLVEVEARTVGTVGPKVARNAIEEAKARGGVS